LLRKQWKGRPDEFFCWHGIAFEGKNTAVMIDCAFGLCMMTLPADNWSNMEDRQTKGRIFDIQRFSIHDGKGIRTIVFLKGCVLRCRWCCNPESQEYKVQAMKVQGVPKLMGVDVTVEDVLGVVKRDRPYYRRSGGGLTLSGGEALCQPEFTRALLKCAKEEGLTTAMESMGCAEWSVIEGILPYLDQYLLDIKHMDPQKHKEFTGKSNELMLENAMKIARSGMTQLSIRVPVIPTFNATVDEIQAIARYADTLPGVQKLHLLPYHRLGQDKYEGLGREYLMKEIVPPNMEFMENLKKAAQAVCKLDIQIGG